MNNSEISGNVKLYKRPHSESRLSKALNSDCEMTKVNVQMQQLQLRVEMVSEHLTKLAKQIDNVQIHYAKQEKLFHENSSEIKSLLTSILEQQMKTIHYETIYEDFIQTYFFLLEGTVTHQPVPAFLHRPNNSGLRKETAVMESKKNERKSKKQDDNNNKDIQELKEKLKKMEQLLKEQQDELNSKPIKSPSSRNIPFGHRQTKRDNMHKQNDDNKFQPSYEQLSTSKQLNTRKKGITFRDIQNAESIYSAPTRKKTKPIIRNSYQNLEKVKQRKVEVKQTQIKQELQGRQRKNRLETTQIGPKVNAEHHTNNLEKTDKKHTNNEIQEISKHEMHIPQAVERRINLEPEENSAEKAVERKQSGIKPQLNEQSNQRLEEQLQPKTQMTKKVKKREETKPPLQKQKPETASLFKSFWNKFKNE